MAVMRVDHAEKMYSIFLIFVWRRKLFILLGSLVFLIGVWAWTFYHAEYNVNGSSISDGSNKILTVQEFDGARDRIVAKYGGASSETQQDTGVRFVRPTYQAPLVDSSMRLRERFQSFSSLFSNKDAAKVLQNLEQPSRDDIGARKDAEHIHLAAERQSQYERELHRMGVPIVAGIGRGAENPPNQRLVHLDLKGAPPKISYLKRILPIIKTLGATGLLIEYEDMFSFMPPIERISAKNAYTETELRDLLQAIAATGLTVMPLVQTFGHLEFTLKLKEYEHLREVSDSPQSLCPSRNESINLVETMIRQVIEMHQSASSKNASELSLPKFTHIHIGCDEVYRIGLCDQCQSKSRNDLFLSHVRTVAQFIRKNWPHLKVVVWDDMLRTISLGELQKSKISTLVEPMVWVYVENIYRFVTPPTWDKYSTLFPTVWAASAFKGAFGESLQIPLARRHLENNLKWLSVINAETSRFPNGIQGIAITGWQRYDHFAVLCELLPVAIPTLALCLSVTANGYFDTDLHRNHITSALTCPEPSTGQLARHPWLDLHHDSELNSFSKCMFPGSQVLRFVTRLMSTIVETRQYLDDQKFRRGWLTPYNIRHNFTSPIRVEDRIGEAVRFETTLNGFIKNADDVMIDVYDKWTIDEFIEQTIVPLLDELRTLIKSADQLMAIRVWPRRPIPLARNDITDQGNN